MDAGSNNASPPTVTLADIEDARRRLIGVIRPTPARFADALSRALGRPVILKPEHLQRTGTIESHDWNPGWALSQLRRAIMPRAWLWLRR
jgi:hypothetical protein